MKPTYLDLERMEKRLWKNMVEYVDEKIIGVYEDMGVVERLIWDRDFHRRIDMMVFTIVWGVMLIGLVVVYLKK